MNACLQVFSRRKQYLRLTVPEATNRSVRTICSISGIQGPTFRSQTPPPAAPYSAKVTPHTPFLSFFLPSLLIFFLSKFSFPFIFPLSAFLLHPFFLITFHNFPSNGIGSTTPLQFFIVPHRLVQNPHFRPLCLN